MYQTPLSPLLCSLRALLVMGLSACTQLIPHRGMRPTIAGPKETDRCAC